jgi:transcriptional regulator with XRE-family HTH domain
MSFGQRLSETRKKRGLSQEDLAAKIGTQGPAIGRYERGIAKPTIEVASKLATILEVSLDYLVGNTETELSKNLIERIEAIQTLDSEAQKNVFALLDAFLRDYRTKQAYK